MKQKYDIEWLTERLDNGKNPKFLFFWGQTPKPNGEVSKACLSQWHESSFEVDGITYKTAEHWMMSGKALLFGNMDINEKIIQANSPGEAQKLGRQVRGYDGVIWKKHRSNIVRLGNIHKFNQNEALGEFLLKTHNRIMVEASPVDAIWGIGLDENSPDARNVQAWKGLNLLGFALMEARDFLSEYGFFKSDFDFKTPWNEQPDTDRDDLFWKTEKGEALLLLFSNNWEKLNQKEKEIFSISFPEPKNWDGLYD